MRVDDARGNGREEIEGVSCILDIGATGKDPSRARERFRHGEMLVQVEAATACHYQ